MAVDINSTIRSISSGCRVRSATRFTRTALHAQHRWTSCGPFLFCLTATGSIRPPQAFARSPGLRSTCLEHKHTGQWLGYLPLDNAGWGQSANSQLAFGLLLCEWKAVDAPRGKGFMPSRLGALRRPRPRPEVHLALPALAPPHPPIVTGAVLTVGALTPVPRMLMA